jgi:hypothetical protein
MKSLDWVIAVLGLFIVNRFSMWHEPNSTCSNRNHRVP